MEAYMKLAFLLVVAGCLLAQVSSHHDDDTTLNLNRASFQMFQQAHKLNVEGKNLVVSPVSMLLLIALYSAGTTDYVQKDILSVLGAKDEYTMLQQYTMISHALSGVHSGNAVTSANKILVAKGNSFTPPVVLASYALGVDVESLDFSKPDIVANLVNTWAAQKTHGLISHPVNRNSFAPDTVVALFNAIYFKGHWLKSFDRNRTEYKDFTTDSGAEVPKPMMRTLLNTKYYKVPGVAEFVEIPYNETDFKMVVGLPDQSAKASLSSLVDYMEKNPGPLMGGEILEVDLLLPKFEIRTKLDNMNEVLQGMGLNRIFIQTADNFVQNGQVSVSKTFQQAYIAVDEVGTEAAVVSGMIVVGSSLHDIPPKEFHADRPFVYAIYYGEKVVFAGTHSQ